MANNLYDAYVEDCLDSSAPDLSSVNVKCMPVCYSGGGTNYSPTYASDDFLNDVTAGARAQLSGGGDAASANLGSKTITGGVFDSADVTWGDTIVANSGNSSGNHGFVMYNASGASSGIQNLICFFETGTGIPFTPSGGNITLQPAASGWFDISST